MLLRKSFGNIDCANVAMPLRRSVSTRGRVIIVRYADDFVMGFQEQADAQQMMAALAERLAQFRLALHRDKTRLLEFGKLVAETPTGAPRTTTGDVCVSRLHAVLRVESRRALCGQAEHRVKASDSEAARGPDGDVAPHAHTGAGATWLAEQRVAGGRRLLRSAEQLAAAGELSPGDHAPLVSSASPAESTSPHVGAIQRVASSLPASSCPNHSLARGLSGERWVTLVRSRVRESRSLG